jgi:hypothetical protein
MTQLELDFGEEFARPPEQTNEIITLAQTISDGWWLDDDKLKAFAELVADKERERIKEENQRCYVDRGEA